MKETGIEKCRKKIDRIDRRLIRLLSRRYANIRIIGRIKKSNNVPIVDKERENEILNKITALRADGECKSYIKSVFGMVFLSSRSVENQEKGT